LVEVVHQGKIWAESEGEGKGSTFTMRIPKKLDPSEVDNDSARAVSM
jgi:signal transduction histidine kinase